MSRAKPSRVIFRAERSGAYKNDVTAVLPDIDATWGRVMVYDHIGQHSEVPLEWVWTTRTANPTEYADLLEELQSIYENQLVVRPRLSNPVGGWRK